MGELLTYQRIHLLNTELQLLSQMLIIYKKLKMQFKKTQKQFIQKLQEILIVIFLISMQLVQSLKNMDYQLLLIIHLVHHIYLDQLNMVLISLFIVLLNLLAVMVQAQVVSSLMVVLMIGLKVDIIHGSVNLTQVIME